jgi:hypothetical protein
MGVPSMTIGSHENVALRERYHTGRRTQISSSSSSWLEDMKLEDVLEDVPKD